ncbi:transcriptional regulator, GntR family [Bifidobacterium sp. DSM 109958]|uniref:Transcriptional regulator, GntR family n=1 Tax=Bifidobacterium moraviense TaxID=2675323 RepID=A0A7Y0F2S5_9BIFI|nr:GntR family transcriptional regulator [Bifidobacterium sp. DSM 109958]NMN00943.1 transcriptional regulator, GntR family [Bifidobacterium sp. DSM 109958]
MSAGEDGEERAVSKAERAYAFLRRRIVFCEARPGDLVDEKAIAADLGFSRTPVHEAIARLAEEGLLRVYPRRGIVVTPISVAGIDDMLDARLVIEPASVRAALARGSVDRAVLLTFRDDMERRIAGGGGQSDTIEDDFDFRFHMYFAQAAGNRYLTELMARLMAVSQRIRFFSALAPDRILASYREHVAIIDAVLSGDADAAEAALRAHLDATREGYLAIADSRADFFAE